MSKSVQVVDAFELNPENLGTNGINAVRAAFGLVGVIAIALGIALLVWPGKSIGVVAAIVGIYLIIAGIARLALGIFSRGLSGGHRTLDLILGVIALLGGIVLLRNLQAAATVLVLIAVIALGVAWIIEGVTTIVESGSSNNRLASIVFGTFGVFAGIVVIGWPSWSALGLSIVIGIVLVALGVTGVYRAFTFGKNA